ncbi:hypothetical protein [Thermococcus sibiricus]|uniref:Uncharacterized protein n=1 Tax=Thermococcus sibiricus TaxID=172049 RepID=A0A101EMS0_9EURY|nr:hypothetical protein [Thermococcus sibiricus]KUK18019.1 MAG: hypothetical protein XD54_0746 [Thermococcus sibiricus]
MRSIFKVIGWLFFIVGITLLISTLAGWIPPDYLGSLTESTTSTEESYKVSYRWSDTSPTLLISIQGYPRNITILLSDPDGITIKKEKITKEELLDEKELITVNFEYYDFKLGEYTLIIYDSSHDNILYKTSLELFKPPKVSIGNIDPEVTVSYDRFRDKIVYNFKDIHINVTNLNPTPAKIRSQIEIISQNNKKLLPIDCIYIPPTSSVLLKPQYYLLEFTTEPTENQVTIKVTVYDCHTGEQLDMAGHIIRVT